MLQHLVAVYVDKFLRDTGQESGGEAGDFRPLASSVKKNGEVPGKERNIAAGTVFEDEGESAGGADARNGRRGKAEGDSRRQFAQLLVEMRLDGLKLLGSRRARRPRA